MLDKAYLVSISSEEQTLQGRPQHTPDTEAPLSSSHLEHLCHAASVSQSVLLSATSVLLSRPIGEEALKRQLSSLSPPCSQAISYAQPARAAHTASALRSSVVECSSRGRGEVSTVRSAR